MIELKLLRKHPDQAADALAKRGFDFDRAAFQQLDERRKKLDISVQSNRNERNKLSRQIGAWIAEGISSEEARARVAADLERLDASSRELEDALKDVGAELESFLLGLPNIPAEDAPQGAGEDQNVEVCRWGEPKSFDFQPLDHAALGDALGQMDFESAAQLAGSRFVVMSDQLAKLHRVLGQFMLDLHVSEHSYSERYVPYIANHQSLIGTGQLPKFGEDLFAVGPEAAGFYLIPTAEVPLTNLARDQIVDFSVLPLRYACLSPCFRSEAGSYGRDTRGMIRQHQFDKVELVQLCAQEQAAAQLEELTGHAEKTLQRLDLPYRKVLLCAGDLGVAARKTYDLEVWLPSQQCYREISSCSDFGDYQARRIKARWRARSGAQPQLLNTVNGSAVAVGRALVAIIENGQNRDGSIVIPKALRSMMGAETIVAV